MKKAAICCVLLCVFLAACQKRGAVSVDAALVDSFFQSQEDVISTLNLEKSNIRSSNDLLEEYQITLPWCGKNLPTTLNFYRGVPLSFSATTKFPCSDQGIKQIRSELTMFEAQFTPKTIHITNEQDNQSVDFDWEVADGALKNLVDRFGFLTFTFTVPGHEDDIWSLVNYTCKKTPEDSGQVSVEYSIQNHHRFLDHQDS